MQRNNTPELFIYSKNTSYVELMKILVRGWDYLASNEQSESAKVWLLRESSQNGMLTVSSLSFENYKRLFQGVTEEKRCYHHTDNEGKFLLLQHRYAYTKDGWKFIPNNRGQLSFESALRGVKDELIKQYSASSESFASFLLYEKVTGKSYSKALYLTPNIIKSLKEKATINYQPLLFSSSSSSSDSEESYLETDSSFSENSENLDEFLAPEFRQK